MEPRFPKQVDDLPTPQKEKCHQLMQEWARESSPAWELHIGLEYRVDDAVTLRAYTDEHGQRATELWRETVLPDGTIKERPEEGLA
jgi:hypothetical protein